MRSSKSRSRNKNNRNRSVGNIVNRVFDSSGPEGKVRGTPQQIIDKYNQLARDAQLANDRVAAENFQQHAEHYLRMLADALREQQERQAQQQQNQQNQNNGNNQNNSNADQQPKADEQPRIDPSQAEQPQPEVIEAQSDDNGLVETPEDKPQKTRRPRRKPPQEKPAASDAEPAEAAPAQDAAE